LFVNLLIKVSLKHLKTALELVHHSFLKILMKNLILHLNQSWPRTFISL